ncbi:MAG: 3-phosphoshikimate 1-carboxyvinyltransferase [Firmicutes bacterium]|nr:3-phosphoshikimate 1-carboxyvinyltransferase [Bacillota bacterium]
MTLDKKADGSKIRLILLSELGEACVKTVTKEQLEPLTIDRFPSGQVFLPPSKSVGHRAMICAALADGGTVHAPGENDDIRATLRCLEALKQGASLLDCGESGSTLRFLIPLAALEGRPITFTGQGRLMDRPLGVYEDCLGTQGVTFTRQDKTFTVCGPLQAGTFRLPGNVSSQFITGLLLALPLLSEDSTIIMETPLQSASYVDLTLSVLKDYGITIYNDNHNTYHIPGNQTFQIRDYTVEADFSGAAFFLAAAALGRPLELMGLNLRSVQGDRAFLDLLEQAGYTLSNGPHGGLQVHGPVRPKPLTVDVGDIPDLVPPLAALLAFADGESRIVNAGRLRIKESDRLATVTRQLNNLGADVIEGEDHLIIRGKERLSGGNCSGENDHRIAMMCAVAAIGCEEPVTLTDYKCVKKSYPNFWDDFMEEF